MGNVAVVGNQTRGELPWPAQHRTGSGREIYVHLVSTLSLVWCKKAFAPEHGFRGDLRRRRSKDGVDKFDRPSFPFYGNNKKPTKAILADVDIIPFDIQDVGVVSQSYLPNYVMEVAADSTKRFISLTDLTQWSYIDGPIRAPTQEFCGNASKIRSSWDDNRWIYRWLMVKMVALSYKHFKMLRETR
jgi:hypothetical protein